MKVKLLTVTIEDKCIDLPKDMNIPNKGDNIFIENKIGVVDYVSYHIIDGEVFAVAIFTKKNKL